jgi:mRNA-degrading endonuclease RelE of RelBE toxin-antitoxin system
MVSYDIVLHPSAEDEYQSLKPERQGQLKSVLQDVAATRAPSEHSKIRHMEGQPGLLRLRVGDTRAIIELSQPQLRVLKIGNRDTVYQDIDTVVKKRLA